MLYLSYETYRKAVTVYIHMSFSHTFMDIFMDNDDTLLHLPEVQTHFLIFNNYDCKQQAVLTCNGRIHIVKLPINQHICQLICSSSVQYKYV